MKKNAFCTIVFVIIACFFCSVAVSKNVEDKSAQIHSLEKDNPCIAKITISRVVSPWREISGDIVKAEKMDTKLFAQPKNLAKYNIGGKPLFGIDKEKKQAVVNSKYFTNLNRVDATRIGEGETKPIGRFLDTSFSSLSLRRIAMFLLESQIVNTYWHLEANICLSKEETKDKEYVFYFSGTHSYCTNECHDDDLKFAIKINKGSGEISLEGF